MSVKSAMHEIYNSLGHLLSGLTTGLMVSDSDFLVSYVSYGFLPIYEVTDQQTFIWQDQDSCFS